MLKFTFNIHVLKYIESYIYNVITSSKDVKKVL